jgi:phosphatidate cytidylyltransferase
MQFLWKVLKRGVIAVGGLAIVIAVGYMGGVPYFLIVSLLALVGLTEYYSALQTKGYRPNVVLGWVCGFLMLLVAQRGEQIRALAGAGSADSLAVNGLKATTDAFQYTLLILFFCITGTLICQFSRRPGQSAVVNSASTVFGVVYIGLLFSFVLRLRYLDVPGLLGTADASEFSRRMGALFMGAAPVWMCDTAAYLVGSLWGHIRLAPTVSPNKTVEGSAAGLLAAIIGMVAVGAWLGLPASHSVLLGVMMGIVGQLGDLGKSVLKRDIGIKDFGSMLGPHGGVLDRFDAILFSMPLVYWYFWFFYA